MNEIIEEIFNHYSYIEHNVNLPERLKFYKNNESNIASYFIINYIDSKKFEDDKKKFREKLNELEENYITSTDSEKESLKYIIQESFENNSEASQIDKNTSAIYLIQFSDLKKIETFRNIIFSIEESPNYFKRYVIPYTELQIENLKKNLSEIEGESIIEKLSSLANNESEYYKLLERNNKDSTYELIIKLFSKIPFLQYNFQADSDLISLEAKIINKMDPEMKKYNKIIKNKSIDIEKILELEKNYSIDDKDLEEEIEEMIGVNK